MIAIMLFFAVKAAELLQSPIIAVMLAQLLELGGRVLFGAGIILGGFVFAKLARTSSPAPAARDGCRRSSNGRSSLCRWRWASGSWAWPTRS
jgi:hypothetical protein